MNAQHSVRAYTPTPTDWQQECEAAQKACDRYERMVVYMSYAIMSIVAVALIVIVEIAG